MVRDLKNVELKTKSMYYFKLTQSMKRAFMAFTILGMCTVAAHAQNLAMNTNKNARPSYKWVTDTVVNLGKIEMSKPQVVSFEFVNNGKAPLVITKVLPSCGCTSIDFSRNPINPGEKGFVKTTYNAASPGVFHKTLTVFSNTPNYSNLLAIKGEVIDKK